MDVGQLDNRYYTETEIGTWRNSVTQTEMGYLHGVTSDIQTQLNGKEAAGISVLESDFNADTFLYATLNNTPVATSPANVLAALSGHAAATFDWNGQTLNGVDELHVAGKATFNDAGADINYRWESSGCINLLKLDGGTNSIGVGNIALAYARLFSQAPDAQSDIYMGFYADTLSDAVINYGLSCQARGGGGTTNIGVYGHAANAINNYPFKDTHGNYSAPAGWVDVSDRDMKDLIRPMKVSEVDQIYTGLDSWKVYGYVYKGEIPVIGYEKEKRQATGMNGELLWDSKPGKPIYDKAGEHIGDEPDIEIPLMEKVPIYDTPDKAPQRYGLLADEVPDHMASQDRKGIAAGRVAADLVVICQVQKALIADHNNRIIKLEEAIAHGKISGN